MAESMKARDGKSADGEIRPLVDGVHGANRDGVVIRLTEGTVDLDAGGIGRPLRPRSKL